METINDRIFQIIDEDKNLSDSGLAAYLKCSKAAVSKWRHKSSVPHTKYVTSIASYLNVSEGYLHSGQEPAPLAPDFEMDPEDQQRIANRLKEVRADNEISRYEMGGIMGVSEDAIARYEEGDVDTLHLTSIKRLAQRYGLNPAWIIGWSEKKHLNGKEK